MLRDKIFTELKHRNGRLFGKFEIGFDSVKVDYVIDQCGEMVCQHQCQYYFYQLRFICLCPDPRNSANYLECQETPEELSDNAINSIEEDDHSTQKKPIMRKLQEHH